MLKSMGERFWLFGFADYLNICEHSEPCSYLSILRIPAIRHTSSTISTSVTVFSQSGKGSGVGRRESWRRYLLADDEPCSLLAGEDVRPRYEPQPHAHSDQLMGLAVAET